MLNILDLCFSSQGWLNHLTLKDHGGERDLAVGPLLMITETHKVSSPSPAPNRGSSEVTPSICALSLRIRQFWCSGGKGKGDWWTTKWDVCKILLDWSEGLPRPVMKEHLGLWEEERGDQKRHRPPGKPLVSPLLWLLKYYTLLELANPTGKAKTNPPGLFNKFAKGKWKRWEEH